MTTKCDPILVVEASMRELRSLVEDAKRLGFSARGQELLQALIDSHTFLRDEIGNKKATIRRLRQLVFGAKTEKTADVVGRGGKPKGSSPPAGDDSRKKKKRPKGHGRLPVAAFAGADRVKVAHESMKAGDKCPHCTGKVYAKEPRLILRIRGDTPFRATVYETERLRCNLCGEVFVAKAPEGVSETKFDETVASMVALLRYGNGLPFNRIAELQKVVEVPFPASTQWEVVRDAASRIEPAFTELLLQAAQGEVLYNDDTPMKILAYLIENRKREELGEERPERTGTFTSGIVAEVADRRIVLYFTGRQHAGENLGAVLAQRATGLDPPTQMCDGLERNLPAELETIVANCLSHGRRYFVDVSESFPEEVSHVLEELGLVYQNDAETKSAEMSPMERLRFHQERSAPIMEGLKEWLEALDEEKKIEPNSGLGQAIAYVLKRWTRLTLFLTRAGVPLDNNLCERMLKRAILHRKNSLFYKTENGARVGDLFMSLIATAKLAGVNAFDYLNELQRHAENLAQSPADWMPWSYRATIERSAIQD